MKHTGFLLAFLLLMVALTYGTFAAPAYQGGTGVPEWVSQALGGSVANGDSGEAQLSADGQAVVFSALASNLVANDTNERQDIFLYHPADDTTVRVNLRADNSQSVDTAFAPFVSADGRYVAFTSRDNQMTTNDGNPGTDGFVRDVISGTTTLVTIATDGTPGNGDIVVTDLSANGRYVVFEAVTGSLVPHDKNGLADVFVHDRETGVTTRISEANDGTEANGSSSGAVISADGSRLVFFTTATNLATGLHASPFIVVHDRTTGINRYLTLGMNREPPDGTALQLTISDNGQTIAFTSGAGNLVPGDTNQLPDVFRYDLETSQLIRVSVKANGDQLYRSSYFPALSADGRYALFGTTAPATNDSGIPDSLNLYRKDLESGAVLWLTPGAINPSPGELNIEGTHLNGDGTVAVLTTWGAYESGDTGNRDVYLRRDIAPLPPTPTRTPAPNSLYLPAAIARTGIATYPRIANITANANGNSFAPVADANADVVAFLSDATNLVAGDTNNATDAFVWQASSNTITRVSVASDGTQANQATTQLKLSENGRYLLFITGASALATGDTNGLADVYWHDRQTGVTEWVSVGLNGAAGDGLVTGADLSTNGRWVVFSSQARNITETPLPAECPEADCETLYRRDMTTGVTETLLKDEQGVALAPLRAPSMNGDGQTIVYEQIEKIGETKICGQYWVPVYGPVLYRAIVGNPPSVTELVRSFYEENIFREPENCLMGYVIHSITSNPMIARTEGSLLYNYSHSTATQYGGSSGGGANVKPSQGDGFALFNITTSYSPRPGSFALGESPATRIASLSADGRIFAFAAGDLRTYYEYNATPEFPEDTNGLTDIYLFNRETNHYQRITDAATGELSNGGSRTPALSANGRVVVFASEATNLVVSDTNGVMDIYLWQWAR
jgi:Tol biopolymer transport system component